MFKRLNLKNIEFSFSISISWSILDLLTPKSGKTLNMKVVYIWVGYPTQLKLDQKVIIWGTYA